MYGQEVLVGWCVVLGGLALVGYGRSFAGVTRAQRMVRVPGRIVAVEEPAHDGRKGTGIPVLISFQDPSTGQEFTLPKKDGNGLPIDVAWKGREIGILFRPGRPEEFRATFDPEYGRHGVALPNFAVFLVYAALVTSAALTWGYQWGLIGAGVPWTVLAAVASRHEISLARARIARLSAAPAVPGRIVSVTRSVYTDQDGTLVSFAPVVSFTTHEDTTVIGFCPFDVPDPSASRGREVTVRYQPGDPAEFTLDLSDSRRDLWAVVRFDLSVLLIGVAAVVAGVYLL
ncbi:DUF3592 domain-containing protein [Streptomyces niveus]|uniref:DUF3592 domain-containing protein n=1 Tax=Streptomyces niveus TaxID=193462 RepID=A0A1U9R1Q0_STRNV|nr:DUF3592 domain-containing protein [Streptomyces niveus]AQU70432.1 hypothetical protein BBN63_33955 [Streptomyces niveus]